MGELGALGDIIFIRGRRMGHSKRFDSGNFDSHLRIKVMALKSITIGKPCICNVSRPRTHKRDDLYQMLTKLKFRLPACIVCFYYASSSMVVSGNFFVCLVCGP